ncbi:hypothetical protein L6452_01578 [Arctium lappa]|uniref:Uncharacterized protein n=1 Tax=Arctium lappa TaxID=4217 RepID=A0ACB9FH34_ARCLA|nr:hypothetical protein L6452_01578 [Arctium lappa]
MPSIDLDGSLSIQGKNVGVSSVSSVESLKFSGEQRKPDWIAFGFNFYTIPPSSLAIILSGRTHHISKIFKSHYRTLEAFTRSIILFHQKLGVYCDFNLFTSSITRSVICLASICSPF